jgi:predicted transcriptional regulator
MLEGLFGSANQEKVLLFILIREKGFGAEIANFYETDLSPIQKQLEKLEMAGVLSHEKVGRTLLFQFNPRYAFLPELKKLLKKAFDFLPVETQILYTHNRKRPRRKGKPYETN